jgi:hypothetical protein
MPALTRRVARLTCVLATGGLVSLGAALMPAAAQAAEPRVQLSAKPVGRSGQYFNLTLKPGQTVHLRIALGNNGKKPIAARTYASDAYTIINGGFGAELRNGAASATTTWIDYHTRVLTLRPDKPRVLSFAVTVPKGTRAGEYLTSLILENNVSIKGTGSVALNQVVRQAIAVAVRVPGPLRAGLAIGAATHKVTAQRSVVAIEASNTGNRRLTPKAKLVLHDDSGAVVSRASVPMGSFYAHTTTRVEVTLATALDPGKYTVDLDLDDKARDGHASARSIPLTVVKPAVVVDEKGAVRNQVVDVLQARTGNFPVWAIAFVVLVFVLVGAGLLMARRRRGPPPAHSRRRATKPARSTSHSVVHPPFSVTPSDAVPAPPTLAAQLDAPPTPPPAVLPSPRRVSQPIVASAAISVLAGVSLDEPADQPAGRRRRGGRHAS